MPHPVSISFSKVLSVNQVSTLILDDHLNSCVITAVRGEDADERGRVLSEITTVFSAANKI